MAMWHGQFMMLADLNTRGFDVAAMVARHGDGEIVAHFLKQFGISAIRGAGAGDRRRNRGGAYAFLAALRALENGVFVNEVEAPSVPINSSRLRLGVRCDHTPEQIDRAVAVLAEAAETAETMNDE